MVGSPERSGVNSRWVRSAASASAARAAVPRRPRSAGSSRNATRMAARPRRTNRTRWTTLGFTGRRRRSTALFAQLIEALEEVGLDEHLARLGAVGRSDDAVLLHHVHEAGGPGITELQPALDVRHRDLA